MLTATMMNLTIDGTTNRITGSNFAYDAVGNMTSMPFGGGAQTFTYDHDNRVTAATNSGGTETYGYDAMNKRILKTKNGVTDVYFYGLNGEVLGRYRWKQWSGGVWGWEMKETFAYFAGIRVARRDGATMPSLSAWSAYRHDRLSSVGDGSTYLPYGEERSVTANDTHKFATYYRDSSSGLDYADQRYYSSTYGRFLTSDPYHASGGPSDPGSWNRYAYVQGDPVNHTDPSGEYRCSLSSDGETYVRNVTVTCTSAYSGNSWFRENRFWAEQTHSARVVGMTNESVLAAASSMALSWEKEGFSLYMRHKATVALGSVSAPCQEALSSVFGPGFLDRAIAATSTASFLDATRDYVGNMTLGEFGITGTRASQSVSSFFLSSPRTTAFVSQTPNGTPGRTVVLRQGVNAAATTLVHEMLHVVSGLGDEQLARRMGWSEDSLKAPSSWITEQLNSQCSNVTGSKE